MRDRISYKIIASLGPSSSKMEDWQALLGAGADVFRLNTSHLSLDELAGWLERYNTFQARLGKEIPLVLDLQGSKWRLGRLPSQVLTPGQEIELVLADQVQSPGILPVPHVDFFLAAENSSSQVVLNDARIRLKILKTNQAALLAEVILGGEISTRKGVTYAASSYRLEKLSQKDQSIVTQTRQFPFVRYAISYVKDAVEMAKFREAVGPSCYLVAKLERRPAVDQAIRMAESADELWLCRGDLGAELGLKAMAEAVYRLSQKIRRIKVPVMLAGQVLEHLTDHPQPTRSEVCHLYEMLLIGYRGVVLSDETAIGKFPLESVRSAAIFRENQ